MKPTRDLLLDDEKRMLLESVSDFRQQVLDDIAQELDDNPGSGKVDEAFRRASQVGLAAALLSERSGGQGMDAYSFCLALSEVSRASAGIGALLLSHNLALWALEKAGAMVEDGRFLDGGARTALAWPAPEDGGIVASSFVPGGSGAELLVLVGKGGLSKLAGDSPGGAITPLEDSMGLRASRPASLKLDVGNLNDTAESFSEADLDELECLVLLGVASLSLGITRDSFDKAHAYATERYQAGAMIVEHQQIRLMLAGMMMGLEAGEATLRQAAGSGMLSAQACRVAKVTASDAAMSAALDAVQVHGGYGYMRDYEVERLMRDAKYCQSYPRANQEELLALL